MAILCLLVQLLQMWTGLSAPSVQAKNLILISVDTLRADRLSCYGYKNNSTAHFDRWASEGFLFERAFSEYPLTLPAHASMLTGQIPPRHRVRENVGFRLDPGSTTLAEVLKARKYRTAGFIGSYVLAAEFGISQGFDTFDQTFNTTVENVHASTELQRPAPEVTSHFLEWLRQNQDGPFFAFVHFYDPHMPRPKGYDAEVSIVDESLGRIDAFLRDAKLLAKTDIVLTSDHGESLGDHGEEGHGFFVYDSTLHVPLIIRLAGDARPPGRRIEDPVSLIDLMPTILDRLRVESPPSVEGRSLLPLLSGGRRPEAALYAESFVPELQFGWSPLRSLRLGRYKYIDAPRPELYDVGQDRGEKTNISSEKPEITKEYRRRLAELVDKSGPGSAAIAPKPQAPDTLKNLMTLGYLNTGSGKAMSGAARQVDPKDRIAVFERYHSALNQLANTGFYPSVFEDLRRLQAEAPEVRGISYLEAWALELAGKSIEARDKYKAAVGEQPDNPMPRARYATLLLKLRELDEAEKQLKEILRRFPDDYRSRSNLAGVYRMTGRRGLAVLEIQKITKTRPDYVPAWLNLGQLETEQRNWSDAERAFLRVIQIAPRNPRGHLGLASVLRAQGRLAEAARAEQQARMLGTQPTGR